MSAIALQKIVDRQTMLAIVEHRENRNSHPIKAYDLDIGAKVQNALDYDGGVIHVKPYYTNAITHLQQRGVLRFEKCGDRMYMSPTYAGYQWFDRKFPGKYLEIVRKLIADEMTEKNARDCERRRRCSSV
jgi:hypothetical protein